MLSKYFIHNSVNHPARTIVLVILLTLFFISGLRWFVIDDDFLKMFPEGMHSRIVWEDIINEFGDTEFFFIAIGNSEKVLTNKTISDISKITDSISSSPMVHEVISLTTVDKIYSDDEELTIETLIPEDKIGSLTSIDLKEIDNYLLKNPKVKARLISSGGEYTNIAVRPEIKDSAGNNRNNSDLTREIESIMEPYLDSYEIHYAGNAYVTGAVPELIKNDASRLILFGLFLMVLILYLNLRSVFGVFLIVSTILLSVLAMNGFMGWMYFITGKYIFNFAIINTSMPIILLTIANSDGVHIISRYIKENKVLKSRREALSVTISALSTPIFLTSTTTAIAFLSMIFSPIPHMTGFAISISFGIMWAWILSLTYLPSLIRIKRWNPYYDIHNNTIISKLVSFISSITLTRPRAIISYSLIIVLLSIAGISLIDIEVNVIKFFKEDNKIRKSTEFVDNNLIGTMSLVVRTKGDLEHPHNLMYMDSLQQFIDDIPESNLTMSLVDAIKTMNREFNEGDENYFFIPESKSQISQLLVMSNKEQLSSIANTIDYNSGLIHSALVSTSTSRVVEISNQIDEYIKSKPIKSLSFETSGMMVFVKEFVDLVIQSSIISILVSIIAVFIISTLFLRHLKWGLLSIIPLTIAVFMNFGLMGLFSIKLSHLTAILSAIIIGVGVDFAIHFISEYRSNKKKNVSLDLLASETNTNIGYPIMLDVFSNMGFAALLFSDIIPLNYIGGLMVLAMLTTSFGTLTVLSTTMHWLRGRI